MLPRKMTCLTLVLSVLLVVVGSVSVGCSKKNAPPPDAAKYENPDSALGGAGGTPGGPVGLPEQKAPATPASK